MGKRKNYSNKWINIPYLIGAIILGVIFILQLKEDKRMNPSSLKKIKLRLSSEVQQINGGRRHYDYRFFAEEYNSTFVILKGSSWQSLRSKLKKLPKGQLVEVSINKFHEHLLQEDSKKVPIYSLKGPHEDYFTLDEFNLNQKKRKLRGNVFWGLLLLIILGSSFRWSENYRTLLFILISLYILAIVAMRVFEFGIYLPN